MRSGKDAVIFGDGSATRDFCSVRNVVLANLLAATTTALEAPGRVFNIACGAKTTLGELLETIHKLFAQGDDLPVRRDPPRPGDILHSTASIEQAERVLEYAAHISLEEGLKAMAAE